MRIPASAASSSTRSRKPKSPACSPTTATAFRKFVETASFVVTGINQARSVTLGLYSCDGNKLVPAGNVTIPPNHTIPQIGAVVEVRYLYAYKESGSVYQPVYLSERDDIPATDCTPTQQNPKTTLTKRIPPELT